MVANNMTPEAPAAISDNASRPSGRFRAALDPFVVPVLFLLVFAGVGATQPFIVEYALDLAERGSPATRHVFSRQGLRLAPLLVGAIYLVFAPCRLLGVWVICRLGRAWTIRLGTILYLGLAAALCLGGSPWVTLAGCVSIGVGAGLLWTAGSTHVLDRSSAGRYGASSGLLAVASRLGLAVGTLALGLLIARYGYFTHPLLPFGFSLAMGALAFALSFAVTSPPVAARPPGWAAIVGTLRRPRLIRVAAMLFVAFFAYGLFLSHLMPVIGRRFRKEGMPLMASTFVFASICFAWLAGRLSDRIGRWPALIGGYACGGVSMLLMTRFSPFMPVWTLFAAMVALAAPFGAVPVVAMAWIGDIADSRDRPIVYAVTFFWRDIGVVSAAVVAVWLGRPSDLTPGFLAMAAVFFAPALIVAAIRLRRLR